MAGRSNVSLPAKEIDYIEASAAAASKSVEHLRGTPDAATARCGHPLRACERGCTIPPLFSDSVVDALVVGLSQPTHRGITV